MSVPGSEPATCGSCGTQNPTESRFCGSCGASLERPQLCPSCGAENPAGQRFCNSCGQQLGEAPAVEAESSAEDEVTAPLDGERKQVTVLFADVMGSMDMAEQTDPEEWRQIMQRFFSLLSDGVRRFEGTVDKFTGDGIMALFGAPIAHEDHAPRACFAALHIERARLRVRGRASPRQGAQLLGPDRDQLRRGGRRRDRRGPSSPSTRPSATPSAWRSAWRRWPSRARPTSPSTPQTSPRATWS